MDPNTSSATMAAFDDRAMTYQALRDVARGQKRWWPGEGRVNAVYPNGDGKRDIPDSTEQFVDWVWQTYDTTGDLQQLASLYPVVKNVSDYVAARGRARRPAWSRTCPAAAPTISTASSTGRPTCATGTTWPPWRAPPRTRSRSTCSASPRRWASCCTARWPSARRSWRAPARLSRAMRGAAAHPERRVRRRARGQRRAEHAHVGDRERVRAVVRPGAARPGGGGRRSPRGAQELDRRLDVRLPAHRARHREPRAARSSPRSPIRTAPATRTSSRRARPTRGRAGTRARPATASRTRSAPTCSRSCRTTCSASRSRRRARRRSRSRRPALTPMRVSGVAVTQRGRIPITWNRSAPGRFSLQITIPDNVQATIHIPAADAVNVSDGHVGDHRRSPGAR